MLKKKIREIYRLKRQLLSFREIDKLSFKIANQALKIPIWNKDFYHIFFSIQNLKEVNTEPLITILFGKDKNIIIPKADFFKCEMTHYLLTDNTIIKKNNWNIPEPENGLQVNESKLEVIFIPLLAFDIQGNRIGYGKGFYDVFLKKCPDAIKVGLSFFNAEEELINDINSKDIALDYCITPNKIYRFN